jgi:hypothetical protein
MFYKRKNPIEGFEHESKRKKLKREVKIKMGKMSHRQREEHGKNFRKTETDGMGWLSDETHKLEML